MEIIEVTTKAQLNELYKGSALTFENVAMENAERYRDYFTGWTGIDKSQPCYHITGNLMNRYYHLKEDNQYPDGINIICFKLDTFQEIGKIAIVRFEIGGRWFDDVVDNRTRNN